MAGLEDFKQREMEKLGDVPKDSKAAGVQSIAETTQTSHQKKKRGSGRRERQKGVTHKWSTSSSRL
jgi:hypothetical protein